MKINPMVKTVLLTAAGGVLSYLIIRELEKRDKDNGRETGKATSYN